MHLLLTANPLTMGNSFGYYTGIFSTAVTASVNPTATMAVLAALGAIENASVYSPDSTFFNNIADSLNSIPVVNAAAGLPIANPYAAVFLTLVAAIMIILHSFAESKIVSQATVDKLEKLAGWVGITALSLMPLLTNEEVQKTASKSKNAGLSVIKQASSSSSGTAWYIWVLGIGTLIVASVVYFLCYDCVDSIGTICAAVPVKGLNLIEQIIKALIHAGMILLGLTFPYLSFILSCLVALLGILLFRILKRITFYYKEVYIRPVLHRLFAKDKAVAPIHKKTPRRIRKLYPGTTNTIPAFVFKGFGKLPARSVLWIVIENDKVHMAVKKAFRAPKLIDADEILSSNKDAAVCVHRRFYELNTPDKKLDIVISRINSDTIYKIASGFGVPLKDNKQESASGEIVY